MSSPLRTNCLTKLRSAYIDSIYYGGLNYMLKKIRRILAGIAASALVLTSTGCGVGKNTAYALTIDGYQVKAGVYIYYSYSALSEAKAMAQKLDESIDQNDRDALEKVKLEGKDFLTWVKDKTTETCANHVAIIKHFDELGLSLTEEEQKEINAYIDSAWDAQDDMFEGNGIGKESLEEVITMSFKTEAVFNSYYGEGGSEGVTDDQLKDFYVDNHMRAKYIAMDLHDAEGNDLDDAAKKEITDMADNFLKRAKEAGKESEQAMLDEFTAMQSEYDEYVSSKAKEAVGEENSTEPTTEAATESTTETSAETTAVSSNSNSDAEAPTDVTSESAGREGEVTETTAPESNEEATTTTTNPYANETIINIVTTAQNSDSSEENKPTYTPSEKCYNWLLNDAKYGVPEIIEDESEETLYLIVKLDINNRINADDLWSEKNVEGVRSSMFSEDFQKMLDEWASAYKIEKNEKAYKRYDPFDIKES